MRTLKIILDNLNLWYFPEISATPAPQYDKKKKSPAYTKVKEPDNLVRDKGTNVPRVYTDTEDGRAWEEWTGGRTRNSTINESDRSICEERSLDLQKFGIVKVAWATKNNQGHYLSAKQASHLLSKEMGRGYGKRTIEQYYSAINQANSSPIANAV